MKAARQLSIIILAFLCASALYGSYEMIIDPTGNSLGLPFYFTQWNDFIELRGCRLDLIVYRWDILSCYYSFYSFADQCLLFPYHA